MSYDDVDLSDLTPQEREVVQQTFALPKKSQYKVLGRIEDTIMRGRFKPFEMLELQPALLWSRSWWERSDTMFYQNAVGHYRQDGRRQEWDDTNMTIQGMLGTPLCFERAEIRVYPAAKDIGRWLDLIKGVNLVDYIYHGDKKYSWRIPETLKHIPLPTPGTYPPEMQDRVDLVARAAGLIREVNENELPCFRIEAPRKIDSLDCIQVSLQNHEDWKEERRGLESIAVMVGKLWVPR